MLGEFLASVWYKGQQAQLTVCVVDRDFPALFGLPWIGSIKLDWDNLLPAVLSVSAEMDPDRN
jgi:hypothetical protein